MRPTLLLTPGEPAGIGPEIALAVAARAQSARIVLVADQAMLAARAAVLPSSVAVPVLVPFDPDAVPPEGAIEVLHVPAAAVSNPGRLDVANAPYVLQTLDAAARACVDGRAHALVTGPVHKGIINDAGVPFSGHTEYLAARVGGEPVMMLAAPALRVALATTHLPLSAVPRAITEQRIRLVLQILVHDLRERFGIAAPRVQVCGLNPHAGEGGHLGTEDDAQIRPAVDALAGAGVLVDGPWPADTAFLPERRSRYDATLAMYHDQGLPVLKALGFGEAVNVTLGLGIIRTSVDHGTAVDIAGQGRAESGSLQAAISLAAELAARATPR